MSCAAYRLSSLSTDRCLGNLLSVSSTIDDTDISMPTYTDVRFFRRPIGLVSVVPQSKTRQVCFLSKSAGIQQIHVLERSLNAKPVLAMAVAFCQSLGRWSVLYVQILKSLTAFGSTYFRAMLIINSARRLDFIRLPCWWFHTQPIKEQGRTARLYGRSALLISILSICLVYQLFARWQHITVLHFYSPRTSIRDINNVGFVIIFDIRLNQFIINGHIMHVSN